MVGCLREDSWWRRRATGDEGLRETSIGGGSNGRDQWRVTEEQREWMTGERSCGGGGPGKGDS